MGGAATDGTIISNDCPAERPFGTITCMSPLGVWTWSIWPPLTPAGIVTLIFVIAGCPCATGVAVGSMMSTLCPNFPTLSRGARKNVACGPQTSNIAATVYPGTHRLAAKKKDHYQYVG